MRLSAVLLASALGAACLGCFVLDELDSAGQVMDEHTASSAPKPPVTDATGAPIPEEEQAKRARVAEWWANARTLEPSAAPADSPRSIVPCQTSSGTLLTRRSDCLARGGQPGSR